MTPLTGSEDILSLLSAQARARPEATAFVTESGDTLSYRQVHDRVLTLAARLSDACDARLGVRPRVGIVLPNGSELALALLGAAVAGTAAPLNPAFSPAELRAYFRETGIRALLAPTGANGGAAVSAALNLGIPVLLGDGDGTAAHAPLRTSLVPPRSGDMAVVLLTSGSTGRAKVVPLTHRNVCVSAGDVARSLKLGPEDRCLVMWEQHHIGGLVDLLLAPLASGGSVVMTAGFDAARFFELLDTTAPTWFQGVPATLAELVLRARRYGRSGPGSLRLIRSVAAALPPRTMADLEALFGVPVIQTFGMTEASPLISSTRLPPAARKPGSVGRSCGAEIRIVAGDGRVLGPGQPGVVAVRGANVFGGYENDPEANARQFRDGWFHTGDIGYLDADGDLFLTGRLKQLINRGGEKFSPQEIDEALLAHPGVAEAAAFAVPHRTLGEDVAAAVVLAPGAALAPEALRGFLAERLAPFKVPSTIAVLETLPRTPIGKIDRRAVAEAARAALARSSSLVRETDALADFLARLWAHELDLPAVGPDDDFSALGGDSLAFLRITLALEASFGLRISDRDIRRLRTVRETATFLRHRGLDMPGSGDGKSGAPEPSPDRLLGSIRAGRQGAEDDLSAAYARLAASRTPAEMHAAADAVTLYAAPAELRTLLASAPRDVGRGAPGGTGLRMAWHRWRWRRALLRDLDRAPAALSWRRQRLAEHLRMYSDPERGSREKTLIVGFGGNEMRLMLPAWMLLSSLDPGEFDLMLLCDPDRRHYCAGIPGLASSIPELSTALKGLAQGEYARTVGFGTSAGALASLVAALRNTWDGALVVGADSPGSHPELRDELASAAAIAGRIPIRVCFGADNRRDAAAAREIAEILPGAMAMPHPGVRRHNLLHHLHRTGRLRGFLQEGLRSVPGPSQAPSTSARPGFPACGEAG